MSLITAMGFTSLAYFIDIDWLQEAYAFSAEPPKAAPKSDRAPRPDTRPKTKQKTARRF